MSLFSDNNELFESIYAEFLNEFFSPEEYQSKMQQICDETEVDTLKVDADKQEEFFNNTILYRIIKVYRRLLLIRNLNNQRESADIGILQFLYPGLITYLTLTCFDHLGQDVKGWVFFPDWLSSKKLKAERDEVFKKILEDYDAEIDSSQFNLESIKAIYNEYHRIYGLKNSFVFFIENVISKEQRDNLLESIIIQKTIHDNYDMEITFGDNVQKINWLYKLRNNYTHSLDSQEVHFRKGVFHSTGPRYIWEQTSGPTYHHIVFVTDAFKSELQNSVVNGIIETINKITSEKS